ncbi:glycosyltransferase family A protein [Dactylosporangium sp. NPDC049525]|uniref:glycosyltransferase family 2 protein n=1 Tax=Dactylosporangium sp. NPDC049525 TaxID=3154730 RepID=UPI0034193D05
MPDAAPSGPAVTCVVPTHDRPELLPRALRSVLAQTSPPASVIVVDDTGSARPVVDAFDGRIRYVRSWSSTAGASRNLGAALAETPLLAFLDDDDTWHPTFLARCAAELTRPDQSTVDFVAAWTWRCRAGHRRPGGSLPPLVSPDDWLHRNPGLTGSNFVVRAGAFRRLGGFDATLPVNNDLDLFVRALDLGLRYAVVPERLVVQYRTGCGDLSRGPGRASGLAGYRDKYRDRLTVSQRRFLRREQYVALRFPDQLRRRRLAYALLGWLNATPRQCVEVVRHRLNGATLYSD